ncbi:MAG: biotin transporter BioY [Lachnospiraceae bacterium]|nr:biotin transporter BioY [Lachnospiraceae bacterium]
MSTTTSVAEEKKQTTRFEPVDMVYIALSVALTVICSQIEIPGSVPFTMQTFAVMLTVSLLGGLRGTFSVIIYILMGAIGVPVFAGFKGGIGALLGPTGGYIIGFLFTALIMWLLEGISKKALWIKALSMIAGLSICYVFGTVWFMNVYVNDDGSHLGLMSVLALCVFPFIIPEIIKIALALAISQNKALRRTLRS